MKKYQTGGTTTASMLGQSSSLSPWAGPYVTEMLGKGAALADMPYQPYMGPLTAGASSLQQQAFQGLANLTVPSTITGSGFSPAAAYPTPPTYQPMQQPMMQSPMQGEIPYYMRDDFGSRTPKPLSPEMMGVVDSFFARPDDYRGKAQFTDLGPFAGKQGVLGPDDRPLEQGRPVTQEEIERFRTTSQSGGLGMVAGAPQQQPMQQGAPQQQPMQQGAPTTQQQIASLMNPYIEQALNPQLEAAKRQAEIQAQNLQSQYGKAGAYGGSRQGVAEAELQRGLLDRMAGLTGTGYQQAYDKAVDLLGKERNYGLDVLREQQTGGAAQRGIESQGIAADIKQFEEERDYPYKQVQYMQSLLQGLPISTQSYQYAEPSTLSNVMGGAGGILGLLETMGVFREKE